MGIIFCVFLIVFFLSFDDYFYTNFANEQPDYADHSLKPDYADMTCSKHDNADPHYTPINVVYTPQSRAQVEGCR